MRNDSEFKQKVRHVCKRIGKLHYFVGEKIIHTHLFAKQKKINNRMIESQRTYIRHVISIYSKLSTFLF